MPLTGSEPRDSYRDCGRSGRYLLIVATAGVLLSGCAVTEQGLQTAAALPSSSRVELQQPLTVPTRRARSYIQGGAAINRDNVDRFVPYCYFSLDQPVDSPRNRTIKPATFKTGPVQTGGHAAQRESIQHIVAARGWPRLAASNIGGGGNGAVTRVDYVTRIPLQAEERPHVEAVTCAYNGKPFDSHLTLDQIKGILAPIAIVHSARESAADGQPTIASAPGSQLFQRGRGRAPE